MPNVVGERFQITIDKRIREDLGVRPGDLAIERIEDGQLVITFAPRPHRDSLLGILRQPGVSPIDDWDGFMEQARRARSAEILAVLEPRGSRKRARSR